MIPKILVIGAPGNVGTEVVNGLQILGIPFRVGAHNPVSARHRLGSTPEIVLFDFLKPATFERTFAGIESMFLVRPPAIANVAREIAPAIHAACNAGVKHIVFLSIQGVETKPFIPHYKIEKLIQKSSPQYTFLRASFFMQNLSSTHAAEIRESNEIALPVGSTKTSFVDVRDVGAVAVEVLTKSEHSNKAYTLTGAEALDYEQVAAKLSTTLKRPITYTNPFILTFIRNQLKSGKQLGNILVMAGLYTITRFGNASKVTHDVETILGRPPISFDKFAHDYRSSWEK